jgi:ferredoxin--NADP+ reductase
LARSIAIVGSGPAGLAVAERIARDAPQARIDLIDNLPVPFGLARYGLAPDRSLDKKTAAIFARALASKSVAFWGNVALGREFDLADLRMLYDAVVIATGAGPDRRLNVPGDRLAGIWGAGAFFRWLNGDPEMTVSPPLEGVRNVIIIGQGSVALEAARLLARSSRELAKADLDPEIADALAAMPLQGIHVVGRNDMLASRFLPADLAALKKLTRAQAVVDPEALAHAEALADTLDRDRKALLRAFGTLAAAPRNGARLPIRFHFHLRPLRLDGAAGVERVLFTRPDRLGQNLALRGELVITAIGFERNTTYDDRLLDDRGLLAPGLYAAGWAKRGPGGSIAEIVADARLVADRVLKEAGTAPSSRPGRAGLARLLETRGAGAVSLAGWQRIDAAEKAAAAKPRPRRRLRGLSALLTTAAGSDRLL